MIPQRREKYKRIGNGWGKRYQKSVNESIVSRLPDRLHIEHVYVHPCTRLDRRKYDEAQMLEKSGGVCVQDDLLFKPN